MKYYVQIKNRNDDVDDVLCSLWTVVSSTMQRAAQIALFSILITAPLHAQDEVG